jgi:hypothetical protein
MTRWAGTCAAIALWAAAPTQPAHAQATRAELIERQRTEKAQALHPYEAGRLERLLLFVEQREPLRLLNPHDGFFVRYAYPERPTGAGMAVGGGFRHDLFRERARIVLEGGISIRNYQLLRADFFLPRLARGTIEVGGHAAYHSHPQEDFYGLGPDSLVENRSTFAYSASDFQGRVLARPRPWLQFGARAGVLDPVVESGRDTTLPQLTDRFPLVAPPGLSQQPRYGYVEVSGTLDRRDQPGNPRAGGYYHVALRRYAARGPADEDRFRVLDADLQHFFPIFDKKRVIALRGRVISSVGADDGDVPFYFQPTLGGSDSLRSYGEYRFRDRNVIFLNAEYRWEAFSGLDMALFSDWGKVATSHGNVDFGSLKRAYGLGLRFNTYKAVFLRFDIAAGGGEGMRYILKYSNVF